MHVHVAAECPPARAHARLPHPALLVLLVWCRRQGVVFGNRSDFKMNTSIVHESGTLLLGIDDIKLLDRSYQVPFGFGGDAAMADAAGAGAADQFDDEGGEGYDYDGDGDGDDDGDGGFDGDDFNGGNMFPDDLVGQAADAPDVETVVANGRGRGAGQGTLVAAAPTASRIWDLLDPHDPSPKGATEKPARRIKSYRVPVAVASLDQGKKGKKKAAKAYQPPPLVGISDFCAETAMLQAKRQLPRGGSMQSTAFPEFAHLFIAERKRRAKLAKQDVEANKRQMMEEAAADTADPSNISSMSAMVMAPAGAFDDDYGDFDGSDGENDAFEDVPVAEPDFTGVENEVYSHPDYGAAEFGATDFGDADARTVPATYEDLVRQHIESYVAEAQRFVIETDLSRRVQDWESRIKPMLDAELERTPYDIHECGRSLLTRMPGSKGNPAPTKLFADVVGTKQPFEVCRMFLATLQLANQGNVEIIESGSDEMSLKLLTRTAAYDMQNVAPNATAVH